MKYEIIENDPVARFYYQGTHSHPIRRTVLITEYSNTMICGYELREGNEIRTLNNAPIKSYRLDKIAKAGSLKKTSPLRRKNPNKSTLVRKPLINIIDIGV